MGFGARLRLAFGGAKNAQIARQIGVSDAAIGNYINKDRVPELPHLIKIYEATQCSLNWLLFDEGPQHIQKATESFEDVLARLLDQLKELPDVERHMAAFRIIYEVSQIAVDSTTTDNRPDASDTELVVARQYHGPHTDAAGKKRRSS